MRPTREPTYLSREMHAVRMQNNTPGSRHASTITAPERLLLYRSCCTGAASQQAAHSPHPQPHKWCSMLPAATAHSKAQVPRARQGAQHHHPSQPVRCKTFKAWQGSRNRIVSILRPRGPTRLVSFCSRQTQSPSQKWPLCALLSQQCPRRSRKRTLG